MKEKWKQVERLFNAALELEPAAGDVRGSVGAHRQLLAGRHQGAGLERGLARHRDAAPPDQVGRARACLRQPTFHQ